MVEKKLFLSISDKMESQVSFKSGYGPLIYDEDRNNIECEDGVLKFKGWVAGSFDIEGCPLEKLDVKFKFFDKDGVLVSELKAEKVALRYVGYEDGVTRTSYRAEAFSFFFFAMCRWKN